MLHFQGIRHTPQGNPERYVIQIDLFASLYRLLDLTQTHLAQDLEKALEKQISKHISSQPKDQFRKTSAQIFRAKDMAQFLAKDPALYSLKLDCFYILARSLEIEAKWQLIEEKLTSSLAALEPQYAQELLLDANSGFYRLLDAVALFFLSQDDEIPPANLALDFIKGEFPLVAWRKLDQLSPKAAPFWQPRNKLCQSAVLLQRFLDRLFEERCRVLIPTAEFLPEPEFAGLLSLRLGHSRLELIASNPAEIQREHSFEGIKHLLAVLKQLGEAQGERFWFSPKSHQELLGKTKVSERQDLILESVLGQLEKLIVIRQAEQVRIENPILLRRGRQEGPSGELIELLLDRLLWAPNNCLLGRHLSLVPREVWMENAQIHGLVPPLMAYLTSWWLVEFGTQSGVFTCPGRQLLNAFTLQKNGSQQVKFLRKIREELFYMQDQGYLSRFEVTPNTDPFEERFLMAAPLAQMESLGHMAQRLI